MLDHSSISCDKLKHGQLTKEYVCNVFVLFSNAARNCELYTNAKMVERSDNLWVSTMKPSINAPYPSFSRVFTLLFK